MKRIKELTLELLHIQNVLEYLDGKELKEVERKKLFRDRESIVKQLHFQVMGVNLK